MISPPLFHQVFDENIFCTKRNFRINCKIQKEFKVNTFCMSSLVQSDFQNEQKKTKSNLFQTLNKEKKAFPSGFHIIHVQSTLNNTLITLTNSEGQVLSWSSAGSAGFKNARKSTSYAAQAAAEKLSKYCISQNIKKIHVKLKGLGYGKEACLKGLQMNGLLIQKIEDITSIAHNGCRLPKKRRM